MIKSIQLMIFIISLYFFFLISGVFEEKIFKEPIEHNGKSYIFKYPFLTIFFNNLFSLLISQTFLFILNRKNDKIKSPLGFEDKAILGIYSLVCKLSNESSLRYLDYITRIIGKSCKSASIIGIYFFYRIPILGTLLRKMINISQQTELHHSGHGDLFKVFLTTTSIILFSLDESGSSSKSQTNNYILLGYALLAVSLLFDGIIAIKEKAINHEVHNNPAYAEYGKILSWEYMHCFSFWSFIFSIFGLIYSFFFTNFANEWKLFLTNYNFFINIIFATLFSAMGQIFIFQILDKYGPLTLSIITGVRKILSIVVSIIYFNKSLGLLKLVSLILGGSVIIWEILEKSTKSHKTKHH